MQRNAHILSSVLLALLLLPSGVHAQDQSTPPAQAGASDTSTAPSIDEAWSQLTKALDAKSIDTRTQALTSLGVLGNSPRAFTLIGAHFDDKDSDARLAAIAAAGATGNRNFTTGLRSLLDDANPDIAFSAATTLWKMNDHSGEDVLLAILRGERKATSNFFTTGLHSANRILHNPVSLAKIGAMQASSILLPPVGIGIAAYNYMHTAGATSPRVIALSQIAADHSGLVQAELISATSDKDAAVRVAAAEALAKYRGIDVTNALGALFSDSKSAVRLAACAAYIGASTASTKVPTRSPTVKRR